MRNTPCSMKYQSICEFQQDTTSMVTEENSESPIGSAGGTTYTTSVTTGITGHTTEYTHDVNDDRTDDTTTELDLTTLPTTSAMAEQAEFTTFGLDIATKNIISNVINDTEKMTTASVNATLHLTNDDSSCLCRIDQNSTVPLQGIIPNSSAHRNIMLAAGYVPACPGKIQWGNMSLSLKEDQKLAALINALKKELTVAKMSTSLYRRKRISAQDTRPSAVSVGSLGICLFVGFFGIVVAIDASTLYSHVVQRKGKHQ
ncbi:uncharacterized protein [Argopecten irradians]|uniref:uncharacterized protein n=1 Tax=Argopecten irradians TaxID=31199 RepID=UPI00371AADBE